MDRKELEKSLIDFRNKCAEMQIPLEEFDLEEAYPGDSSTSFILKVKSDWMVGLPIHKAIKSLTSVLWDTTTQDVRRNIFAIKILENKKELELEEVN